MRIRKYLAVPAMIALLVPIATSCDIENNGNSEESPQMLSWSDESEIEDAQQEAVEALYEFEPNSPLEYVISLKDFPVPEPLSADENALYNQTVSVLLREDLWTDRDMYDTAHHLMVPMYYAFLSRDNEKIDAFHEFFARFCEDVCGEDRYGFCVERLTVNHLQFCYFASEYLKLCAITEEPCASELYDFVYKFVSQEFESGKDGWTGLSGFRARVESILLHVEFPRSFDSALTDVELYMLAILCDLRVTARLCDFEEYDVLGDAAILAYRIYTDSNIITETENGGFLFQVGVWKDYPDYEYAGNLEIVPEMEPSTRDNIVSDSSYFARQALWLTGFQQAQEYREQYNLFQIRRKQLANQFINYVIHYVDGMPLATTFMDGTFGVYRYSDGVGYQGYSLSTTLLMGWWSFLDDARVCNVYKNILSLFPTTATLSNPYYDYMTTRERNPFFDMASVFDCGMLECIVALATKWGIDRTFV